MAGGYRVAPDGDFGVLVQRLERTERRLAELERPTGSQVVESIARLSALQTFVATSGSVSHTGPGNTNFTSPPSLTFTLPFDSVVTAEVDVPYNANTDANSTAQVNLEYLMGFAGNQLNLFEQLGGVSSLSISLNGARTRTMLYPAGTYTISPAVARVGLTGGTAGIHFINAGPIRLTASVIGTS